MAIATILLSLAPGAARAVSLGLAVEANPDPVLPGGVLNVFLTVTNQGGSTSGNVRLELDYPAELENLSDAALSDGGDCTLISSSSVCNAGETVFWELGPLPPGRGRTVQLPPIVRSDLTTPDTIALDAEALEAGVSRATESRTIAVEATRPLDLSVDADREPVAPGTQLTYELAYGNRGPIAATSTTLSFPLPAGTSFVSASGNGIAAGGSVDWSLGTLEGHIGGVESVTVLVANGSFDDGDLVEVDSAVLEGTISSQGREARALAATRVESGAPLRLAVAANPDPVEPGETLLTEVTVSNSGATSLFNVEVQLYFPPQLANLDDAALSDGGDCTFIFSSSVCNPRETVVWDLGTLPPGRGETLLLPPIVAAPPGGELTRYIARAKADNQPSTRAFRTVVVETGRPLDLAVDADREPVTPGTEITYDLTYGNRGSIATTSTTLTFPLPAGTSFVAASNGGSHSGGKVDWSLGTLEGHTGGVESVTVEVENASFDDGDLVEVNTGATLEGNDGLRTHQTRTVTTTRVESDAPLELAVAANPDPVEPGETLLTEVTVSNSGTTNLFNVQVQLYYPPQLANLDDAALSDGGDCTFIFSSSVCNPPEVVFWDLGTLPPGGGETVFLPPVLAPTSGGDLTRYVARAIADAQPSTRAFRTVVSEAARQLDLSVDVSREPVPPGSQLRYDLTFGNRGAAATTNTSLRFPLPTGTTFVSATGGGTASGGSVNWSLGALEGRNGGSESVTVLVSNAVFDDGDLLEVNAGAVLAGDGAFRTHQARSVATTRVQSGVPISLALTAQPDRVRPGDTLLTKLTATNITGSSLFNVRVELLYPPQLFALDDPFISDGGDCTFVTSSSVCNPGEVVFWDLGTFTPGFQKQVSLPPIVATGSGGPLDGSLIRYRAQAFSDAFGKAEETIAVLVAPPPASLLLSNDTVNGVETFEACETITLLDWMIVAPARVTLRAPLVTVANGASVGSGAELSIFNQVPVSCN